MEFRKIFCGSLFVLTVVGFNNCANSDTRVAVKNQVGNASKIKIRNSANDSASEMDFGEVANGATTTCRTVSYGSMIVNINATDNAQNGSVNLKEKEDNLITVSRDGTNPTVSQSSSLCN